MTPPVLLKRTFLVALMTGIQALVPAFVAIASLYTTISIYPNLKFDSASTSVIIAAVLCLMLVQPPREVTDQIAMPRLSAVVDVLLRWLLLLAVFLAVGYVTKTIEIFPRRIFLTWAFGTPVLLSAATLVMNELMRRLLISVFDKRTAVVAGYNNSSWELARRLADNPGMRLEISGFFDDRSTDRLDMEPGAKLVGTLNDLAQYVKDHGIDIIFIALPIRHVKRVMNLLDDLRDTTVSIYYVPDIFVFDLIQARSGEVHGIPVVAMCETPFYGYRGVAKRLTDICLSLIALLLFMPMLAIIALLVKVSSPGPILFKQRRYGLDGAEIAVYKFRSMRVQEDGAVVKQASRTDDRITPVGRILRRSSLDELPQLINVLQGRMSLVGPRPHAVAHNEEYRKLIKGYMVRHKVLPGITGLAQVNGCRGETAQLEQMEARVTYDLDYLRHWSLMLDFKILMLTVLKVFRDDKAY